MRVLQGVVTLAIVLFGCSAKEGTGDGSRTEGPSKPTVYASNYPLKYFAERISTPLVDVRLSAPADEDPAFWKPAPDDIAAMQQADLIILNGGSYESWLKNVSLPTSRLVDTSAGFKERFIAQAEVTTHGHGLDGEHEHSATAFTTWLDFTLAVEQARAIENAFARRWPEHQAHLNAQLNELVAELNVLDSQIKETARQISGVPVLFSHPVYQYFARQYDLNGRSLHWEPHEMPSDAMWQELSALVRTHPAKWMIWEGQPAPEIKAKLAAQGIQSIVFDPCGSVPDGGDFVSVMRQNAAALKTLSGQ